MGGGVDLLEPGHRDLGVDLGGGEIRMAQHLLDGADGRSIRQREKHAASNIFKGTFMGVSDSGFFDQTSLKF